jgi:hypothetical protein
MLMLNRDRGLQLGLKSPYLSRYRGIPIRNIRNRRIDLIKAWSHQTCIGDRRVHTSDGDPNGIR